MTAAAPSPVVSAEARAKIKQSLKEKLTGKAHAKGSDSQLEAMKLDAINNIKIIKEPANIKYRQASNLADAISELSEFDFVKSTAGGGAVLARGALLRSRADKMMDLLGKTLVLWEKINNAHGKELSKPLGDYAVVERDTLDLIEELAQTLDGLGRDAQTMLEVKAIEAWVNKHPDKINKLVGALKKVGNVAFAVATEGVPPAFKPAAAAAAFLKDVIYVGVDCLEEARQVGNYQAVNMKGAAFGYLDEDPSAMASMVADIWKTRFNLLMSAASVAANQIPGWETIIRPALEGAAAVYFDAPVKKLKRELEAAKLAPGEVAQSTLGEFVKDTADDVGGELLSTLVEQIAKLNFPDIAEAGIAALKTLLTEIATEIVSHFPIDPAQAVDGGAVKANVSAIAQASVWTTEFHRKGEAQKPDYETPETDAAGNPIETILSTMKETDDTGDYLWVRIGGQVGKLYLDDKTFDATAENEELAKIPAKDSRNRAVEEVRAGLEGGKYTVRIGDVWGLLDPAPPHKFTAVRPDDNAYAEWSDRVVSETGYKTADGTEVAGKWYRPWPDKYAFMFWRNADNVKEWAQATQLTGNVAGSMEYSIGELIGPIAIDMDGANQL